VAIDESATRGKLQANQYWYYVRSTASRVAWPLAYSTRDARKRPKTTTPQKKSKINLKKQVIA